MARYLLTGAAGFIGARTGELLLEAGHEVVGVDSLNDAYDVRVKEHRLEILRAHAGFELVTGNVADRALFAQPALTERRFDAVLNLAARAGVRTSVENPWIYVETNVVGTLNCLEFCREREVDKLVLASTSSLYGKGSEAPYTEDQETGRPLSPYAASKGAAEMMAHSYHALFGIDVTVLRYFTVYGPRGRPDMSVFRFTQRIREGLPIHVYGDGSMSRDFTYVDDIARGTIAALRPLGYEIVNLGSDRPHTVRELVGIVEECLGRTAKVEHHEAHPADVPRTWADITKARRLLDWEPRVALREGVALAAAWYERERDWAKDVRVY